MSELPIMIFHQGNQRYVKDVIRQAEKWNQQVWLLGDVTNRSYAKHWADSTQIQSELFHRFLQCYVHMSTRSYQAEMFCFESHFKYYEFAKSKGWKKFLTLDSDVLVYQHFDTEEYAGCDAAFGWNEKQGQYGWAGNPYVAFWTIEAMEDFLQYCIWIYNNAPERLSEKWHFHQQQQVPGGICDMTLFWLWKADTDYKISNNTCVQNGTVYDQNIGSPDNFHQEEYQMSRWYAMKKIHFKGGCPYLQTQEGKRVRAKVLHCLGTNKKYIPVLKRCTNRVLPYLVVYQLIRLRRLIKCLLSRRA